MVEHNGPDEIERITLKLIVCLHCGQQFPDIATATIHDKICSEHPAVQQLAVAKRFIADLCEKNAEVTLDGFDVQDAMVEHGILVEEKYDPALHGPQDAEVGEAWYVVAEKWRGEP